MKDLFRRMFNYDKYANQIILELITKATEPDKAVQLMAHLLAVQLIWLNRCKGVPTPGYPLLPNWTADKFEAFYQ